MNGISQRWMHLLHTFIFPTCYLQHFIQSSKEDSSNWPGRWLIFAVQPNKKRGEKCMKTAETDTPTNLHWQLFCVHVKSKKMMIEQSEQPTSLSDFETAWLDENDDDDDGGGGGGEGTFFLCQCSIHPPRFSQLAPLCFASVVWMSKRGEGRRGGGAKKARNDHSLSTCECGQMWIVECSRKGLVMRMLGEWKMCSFQRCGITDDCTAAAKKQK